MEISFKSLAAGRTAGIKEVQQNVLGISKEESDELMDGVSIDQTAVPDDTTVKVKRKNIKLKYVPTEVPENEESGEAESTDE